MQKHNERADARFNVMESYVSEFGVTIPKIDRVRVHHVRQHV